MAYIPWGLDFSSRIIHKLLCLFVLSCLCARILNSFTNLWICLQACAFVAFVATFHPHDRDHPPAPPCSLRGDDACQARQLKHGVSSQHCCDYFEIRPFSFKDAGFFQLLKKCLRQKPPRQQKPPETTNRTYEKLAKNSRNQAKPPPGTTRHHPKPPPETTKSKPALYPREATRICAKIVRSRETIRNHLETNRSSPKHQNQPETTKIA